MKKLPSSLKWQLVTRIVLAQAFIVLSALALFVAFLWLSGFVHERYDRGVIDVIKEAVSRDGDGHLTLQNTAGLAALRRDEKSLWFIIHDASGNQLIEGTVPDAYRTMTNALSNVLEARLGDDKAGASRPDAVIRREDTSVGRILIMASTGGGLTFGRLAEAIGEGFKVLVLPGLLLAAMAALLVIPLVVRMTLRGASAIAEKASQIEPERRGIRLPTEDVPAELSPLVDAFNGALERLDQGYSRQQRFLAQAAHELRTPIAILSARLHALPENEVKSGLTRDVARLGTLAGQLLDLQRLEGQSNKFHAVDIVSAARWVISDMAPLAFAAGYDVVFDNDAEVINVRGDRQAIERAITNLFQNAIDHGDKQGTIAISVLRPALIEVADEGKGIPSDMRKSIFEPFNRLDDQGPGAGLGLNLVQQIMALHEGTIEVGEASSGGARMRLVFPQTASSSNR
nr:HAMP domain-containing sensor histidine kinase [Brucella intermedia]